MVQVYDPYIKEWKDWEQTGAIILPSTITITTTTLNGQPVTCVLGDYSQTTVFVDGEAVFQDIFTTGTATITSGEFSVEVEITETGGSYEGVLEEVVELVLWDGANVQNGATIVGYDAILGYQVNTSELSGKKLMFRLNEALTNNNISTQFYNPNLSINKSFTLKGDGSIVNATKYGSYDAGIYTYDIDVMLDLYPIAKGKEVNFRFSTQDGNNKWFVLATYYSKIWLE